MPKYLTYKRLKGMYTYVRAIFLYTSFLLLFSLPNSTYPQVNTKDSLALQLKTLEKNNTDYRSSEKYIDLLNSLAHEYRFVKADSVYKIATIALNLSKKLVYLEGQCNAFANLGDFYSDSGKSAKAISNFFGIMIIFGFCHLFIFIPMWLLPLTSHLLYFILKKMKRLETDNFTSLSLHFSLTSTERRGR